MVYTSLADKCLVSGMEEIIVVGDQAWEENHYYGCYQVREGNYYCLWLLGFQEVIGEHFCV